MLCDECQEIFSMELKEDTQYAHYGIKGLEAEANNGCHLCLLVWHGISARKNIMQKLRTWVHDNPGKDTSTYVNVRHDEIYPALEFTFRVGDFDVEDADVDYDGFEISMEAMQGVESLPEDDSAVQDAESTGSEATMKTAIDWMQVCLQTHNLCHRDLVEMKSLPTRLIEIAGHPDQPTLRLCSSSEIPSDTQYVSLSHCWGDFQLFTLKTSNLESLKENVDMSELPKTFREAVKVTQRLGFSYIWIDSICIMQDSKQDRERETATMADVYSGAQCNIAASASRNGGEGLFRARNPCLARPLNVWATWKGEGLAEGPYTLIYADPFEVEILPEPLNRRAWVFQERLLSRRVLQFGTNQVHWKCRENMACEAFPDTLPFSSLFATDDAWIESLFSDPYTDAKYGYDFVPGRSDALAAHLLAERHKRSPQEHLEANLFHLRSKLYSAWIVLVAEYSQCDLTYSSDRPLAISGVARAMAAKLGEGDRYIAGMWESKTVELLLFGRDTKASEWPETPRAPSWSWLARDGPVKFTSTLLDSSTTPMADAVEHKLWRNYRICEVLEATTEDDGGDSFSSFPTGTLRLKGFLAKASISQVSLRRQWILWSCDRQLKDMTDIYSSVELDGPADLKHLSKSDWHIVTCIRHDSDRTGSHVHGLVLRPTGESPGQFRRHGMFAIKYSDYEILLALRRDGTDWVEPEYEKTDFAGRYTLSIV
jgi:hypothetical protein